MKMRKIKILVFALSAVLILSGCRMRIGGNAFTPTPAAPTETPVMFDTPVPTQTASLPGTSTATPSPDLSLVGLPAESAGTNALDFVATMCQAQWFTEIGNLPCPGGPSQADAGYVMQLSDEDQGLPANFNLMMTFPPQKNVQTISSKYPDFTVKKGDRFRAVLTCRAHAFCDVDFILSYFGVQGRNGLMHWQYIFTDEPIVVDYSLDGLAGGTVQFDLAVRVLGNTRDAFAIWIAPHIYRPVP